MSSLRVVSESPRSAQFQFLSFAFRSFSKLVRGERSVVPDGIARSKTNPLGNGAILLLRFRKLLLGSEGLVGLHIILVSIYP